MTRLLQIAGVLLTAGCLLLGHPTAAIAAPAEPALARAPLSKAFLDHQQRRKLSKGRPEHTASGRSLGYIPPPIDYSYLKTTAEPVPNLISLSPPLEAAASVSDSSYDLRSLGMVTPVRDQGACGACWSFASLASAESNLLQLQSETWDFSENNLKNTHGFDWDACEGGNADMAIAYLARGSGPVNEADDPYNPASSTSPTGLTVRKQLQQALIVPSSLTAIKQALLQYGGLKTSYYHDDAYYKAATYGYYYTGGASYSNHAVTIVGWDDAFPAANFVTAPPGNGAFIIKNSWGTWWGQGGYFYISYHDPLIMDTVHAFSNFTPPATYNRIYQYDPLGKVSAFGYPDKTVAWGANLFTAVDTDPITAVSFHAASPGTGYTIKLYTGVDPANIATAVLALTQTGTVSLAGYHTITLTSPVPVVPGERFAVALRLNTPGYNYPLPIESAQGHASTATAAAGQSFYAYDYNGTPGSWTDLTSWNATANFCIKAFTATPRFTVNAVAGLNGALSPATPSPASVPQGSSTGFTFDATAGYHVAGVNGCNGTPYSNTDNGVSSYSYSTGPISADCTVSASFALNQWPLTVSLQTSSSDGSTYGGGTVTGPGISCQILDGIVTGSCSSVFDHGSSVTLTATEDNTQFGEWTGCTLADQKLCSVTLDADKPVSASFNLVGKARIGAAGYPTLQLAHTAAAPAGTTTILARSVYFTENLTIAKPIILKGGYNLTYSANSGTYSTLTGSLTIGSGSLVVENVIIQ